MKNLCVLILLFGLAVMLGCKDDKVRDFMPGVYVNSAGGAFSVASDTLVVELVEGNNYVIHRSTGFNLVDSGKLGKREHETEEWSAVYNPENQQLNEVRKGKLISFFPKKNSLIVGCREYQKLERSGKHEHH